PAISRKFGPACCACQRRHLLRVQRDALYNHPMSILGWIFFGLIAGFIASRVVNKRGEGCILNVVLGIVGALVGGFIFTAIGGHGVTGFNLYSMLVAVVGAIAVLLLFHALTGRKGFR